MAFSMFRPFREMPKLKLSTKMFLDVDPHQSFLVFANDDSTDAAAVDLMSAFLQFPGVGTIIVCRPTIRNDKAGPFKHFNGAGSSS